jgi:hypothetical protein
MAGWKLDWSLPDVREGYGAPRVERKTKYKVPRVKKHDVHISARRVSR